MESDAWAISRGGASEPAPLAAYVACTVGEDTTSILL